MNQPSPRQLFLNSVVRCLKDDDFLKTFYDRFLDSSEEIAERFKHTDFTKQRKMLAMSLKLTAGAMDGETEALKELRARAETHDHNHLNIRPELYGYWRAALIETAIQFDPDWDIETHIAWDKILGNVIGHMTKHY